MDKDLTEFIRVKLEQGVPENVIRERLSEIGYDIISVGEAFKHVKKTMASHKPAFNWPNPQEAIQKILRTFKR
jgi:hypothetical protein